MMKDASPLERDLTLVQLLLSQTNKGKIDWELTGSQDTFETHVNDLVLQIRAIFDNDYPENPDFALDVIDPYSRVKVHTISNATLRPVMDHTTTEGLSPYGVLEELYEVARRQALGVDDVMTRLLNSLAANGE